MGKNSLIKSTTKKKSAVKKQSQAPKAKGKVKTSPSPKAPPKTQAASAKDTAIQTTAKPAEKKAKPPSIESLLHKKFNDWKPGKAPAPPPKPDSKVFAAPPFFTDKSEAEAKRLQALLLKKIDLEEAGPRATKEEPAMAIPATPSPAPEPPPPVREEKAPAPVKAQKTEETSKTDTTPTTEKPKDKNMTQEPIPKEVKAPEPVKSPPPQASHLYEPPTPPKKLDPMDRMMKFAIAGFGLLILILIAVSAANSKNYSLKSENGGIEIWKGNFAPIGQKRFLVLPGMKTSGSMKGILSEKEAFSLVVDYYLQKADALLDVSGVPDFDGIQKYLKTAAPYAVSESQRAGVMKRLNDIDLMSLIYKADVALGKGTLEGAEEAKRYLEQAGALDLEKTQSDIVRNKIESARKVAVEFRAKSESASGAQKKAEPAKK